MGEIFAPFLHTYLQVILGTINVFTPNLFLADYSATYS
ncbi:hypothetical protein Cal7507_0571 [Calothrix sp. PCC 7507]|nr:hypothetical protein Cal7507_0571 [Calothrix sp. PCC 7507]